MPLIAILAAGGHAQLNLSSFYSNAVKDAKSVYTNVDSVTIQTSVDRGKAKTAVTMVLRPDLYRGYAWIMPVPVETRSTQSTPQQVLTEQALDSIEISNSFTLPSDFVAESLYLWIGTQRVAAQIQDRNLAHAQFDSTVGKRKDPALLEFWGNGSYNLRIFPASSNTRRKVELVFRHTFDDDTLTLIRARLPMSFDTAGSYYYGPAGQKKPGIGFLSCAVSALDNGSYTVSMAGLGAGTCSAAHPLFLSVQNCCQLAPGAISAADPSGSAKEFGWIGADKLDAKINIGFATTLAESTVTLAKEPDTRIIVLDIRDEWWDPNVYYQAQQQYMNPTQAPPQGYTYNRINLWLRAQKFAILCLKNYVAADQKFNVILGGVTPGALFPSPVAGTAANLTAAFTAITAARPDKAASTYSAMQKAIAQAPNGVAILITDLYQPYNYGRYIYDAATRSYTFERSVAGQAYDGLLSNVGKLVTASAITMFTICDEWRLSDLANTTGGFQLSSLRWDYYYRAQPVTVDGVTKYVPALPRLFLERGGISGLAVTSPDGIGDIVFTTDSYWQGGIVPMLATADAAAAYYPYYRQPTALLLRAAGKVASLDKSEYRVTISGKIGGLGFTKDAIIVPAQSGDDNLMPDVQWAFRKTEQLGNDDWSGNALAIKTIGKSYHIVTRQTSLLALEIGVTMWPDSISPDKTEGNTAAGSKALDMAAPAAPSTQGSGGSMDSLSLDQLIDAVPLSVSRISGASADIGIYAYLSSRGIIINAPAQMQGKTAILSLFDARGRCVARQQLKAHPQMTWNVCDKMSTGMYALKMQSGSAVFLFRLSSIK
jgi:hypothetical protein